MCKINLFSLNHDKRDIDLFFSRYKIIDYLVLDENIKKKDLKKKNDRICRFCGKNSQETTFQNAAHSIPHLLGNNTIFNDFECDACNSIFSKYETDLGEYFKIERTIYGTKGKKGIPKIKTNSETTQIIKDDSGMISLKDDSLKPVNGQFSIKLKKTYKPLNVYKSLIKIALSLLSEKDYTPYNAFVKSCLLNKYYDSEICSMAKIGQYKLDYKYKAKHLSYIIFNKRIDSNIPFHLFSLYYENFILIIPLPFHQYDLQKGYYSEMQVTIPPILTFTPLDENSDIEFKQLDLGNPDKKSMNETITITFDNKQLIETIIKHTGSIPSKNFTIDEFKFKLDL